jgi:chemotaxis protein MotB
LTVVMLAVLLTAGGCVPQAKYDDALAACRRANDELSKTKEELQACREAAQQLEEKLAGFEQTLKAKQDEIALLESKNADLQKSLRELEALCKKLQEGGEKPPALGPLLPAPVDELLKEFARLHPELVEYLPQLGMVKFKADLTFEKGSDDVAPAAVEALSKLVEILNNPAAARFYIYVAGHTDDIPIKKPDTLRRHPTNWYLSVHRSVEVEKHLEKAGLAPHRIGLMGLSEYHPIVPNQAGNKGNAKNRRVEIWIVPLDRFLSEKAELAEQPAPAAPQE